METSPSKMLYPVQFLKCRFPLLKICEASREIYMNFVKNLVCNAHVMILMSIYYCFIFNSDKICYIKGNQ